MATENVKYLDSTIMQRLISDVKTKLNQKLDKASGVYQAGGSYVFADLPAAGPSTVGLVYNITDAFTTTSDFIEGEGIEVEAGTDVAVVMTSVDPAVYKYNLFGTAESVDEISHAEYEEMWKDPGVLELSRDSVSIGGAGTSETVIIESASGTVTAESSDTSVATVNISENTITITSVGAGSATITVECAGSTIHRAISKDISVNVLTELLAGGNANIRGFDNPYISDLRNFGLDVKYTDRYGIEREAHYAHAKGEESSFSDIIPILSGSDMYLIFTNLEDSTPFTVKAGTGSYMNLGSDTPIIVKFKTPENDESKILGTMVITVEEPYSHESINATVSVIGGLFGSKSSNSDFSRVGGLSNTFTFQSSYGSAASTFKLLHNGNDISWNTPGPEAPFFDTPITVRVGDTIAIKALVDVTNQSDGEINKWINSSGEKLGNGNTVSYTFTAADINEATNIKVGFNGYSNNGYYTIVESNLNPVISTT